MAIADLDPDLIKRGADVVVSSSRETDRELLGRFHLAYKDRASQKDMPEAQPDGLVHALGHALTRLLPFPPDGTPQPTGQFPINSSFKTGFRQAASQLADDPKFLGRSADVLGYQGIPLPNTIRRSARHFRTALRYYASSYRDGRDKTPH